MNIHRFMPALFALLLAACGGGGTEAPSSSAPASGDEHATAEPEAAPDRAPLRVLEDGSRLFGSEMAETPEVTPLAQILAAPASFDGQVVKTEGQIGQVCQRSGCWLELRGEAEGPSIRVPMSGHSFFLPPDVAGHAAVIVGTLSVEELDEETRAHLESEGAEAAGQDVSIEAVSVLVR